MIIREFGDSSGVSQKRIPDNSELHISGMVRVCRVGFLSNERCVTVMGAFKIRQDHGTLWLLGAEEDN